MGRRLRLSRFPSRLGVECSGLILEETEMLGRMSLAALLFSIGGAAAAQDDASVTLGRELLETYCTACHNIEAAGDSPHEEAPPFRVLHERYELDWLEEGLVEGLVSGHPDMPEFEFDPVQAQSIVAYIKSLNAEDAQ